MSEHSKQEFEVDWIGRSVRLEVEGKSYDFPLDALEKWIAFFNQQSDLFPKARRLYDAKVNLLKRALELRDAH